MYVYLFQKSLNYGYIGTWASGPSQTNSSGEATRVFFGGRRCINKKQYYSYIYLIFKHQIQYVENC